MPSPTARTQETLVMRPRQKFEGHTGVVWGIKQLPGGERIITCSNDGSLRIWNLESGKQIGEDLRDGESEVYTIALSPDGKKVVSGSEDGAVRLWDIDTCKIIAKWTGHNHSVFSVCWSQDGQRVLSGSADGTTRQWEVESGAIVLTLIKAGHTVVYSPDMTLIATGGVEGPIKIYDSKTGKLVATLEGHTSSVHCLAWTPDGKTLISGSVDHSVRKWNTITWKQIAVLDEHTNGVWGIAVSPNGRILASVSFDKTARLWNLENDQPISSPLQHVEPLNCVSFSADGKLLATGCDDKNAYTWDVSAIVRESGLDDLLLDPSTAGASRRPVRRLEPARRVPPGFFDDVSPRRYHVSLSSTPHGSTLLGRVSSLFHRNRSDIFGTPSRPRPLNWARNLPSVTPRHELVDVPCAQGKRRNASAREKRRPIPLRPNNAAAGSSRLPQSGLTQQSSGVAHSQPLSEPHTAVSTSSTTPAVVTIPAATTSRPDATIRRPRGWTRFWLFICCASPEYTESHH